MALALRQGLVHKVRRQTAALRASTNRVTMNKLRWGILSTARIATQKVIPAIQGSSLGVVSAIASRSIRRAREVAQELGIGAYYASYDALLAATDVDAVYIPLPNHMHVEWSIRALEAAKHVLCEKPVGLNAQDARRLMDAAQRHPHLRVAEAFMYRHHPQWRLARDLVRDGRSRKAQSSPCVLCLLQQRPTQHSQSGRSGRRRTHGHWVLRCIAREISLRARARARLRAFRPGP